MSKQFDTKTKPAGNGLPPAPNNPTPQALAAILDMLDMMSTEGLLNLAGESYQLRTGSPPSPVPDAILRFDWKVPSPVLGQNEPPPVPDVLLQASGIVARPADSLDVVPTGKLFTVPVADSGPASASGGTRSCGVEVPLTAKNGKQIFGRVRWNLPGANGEPVVRLQFSKTPDTQVRGNDPALLRHFEGARVRITVRDEHRCVGSTTVVLQLDEADEFDFWIPVSFTHDSRVPQINLDVIDWVPKPQAGIPGHPSRLSGHRRSVAGPLVVRIRA
ncbi:hypothetical protein [Zavarzinella formosa]|uniref:hypothetical protein n=1 Tax=Zavarzinella formosa TaxID=360055 RepID=UPI0002D71378|nr:hypothetical protein [Zavarzinella formosa]